MVTTGGRDSMILRIVRDFLFGFGFLFEADDIGPESEFGAHFLCGIEIQSLVDGGQNPLGDKLLNDVFRLDIHLFRQLFDGDPFGNGNGLEILRRSRWTRQFDHFGDDPLGYFRFLRLFLPDES